MDTTHDIPLSEFQVQIEKIVLGLKGRIKHCGRSAYRHLRRAWELRDIAPELAAFSALTAEEEAATALIIAIQRKKYPNSELLNHRSHLHKVAITPFLRATAWIFESLDYAAPQISVSHDEKGYWISVKVNANKLMGNEGGEPRYLEPVPPLNFTVRDKNGSADFGKRFSEFTSEKGQPDVFEFIKSEANARNKLLYASDVGIAHVKFPEKFFRGRAERITTLFTLALMIEQSDEHQLLVSQALDSFLQILKRIDVSQFEFPHDDENFEGLLIEKNLWRQTEG